MNGWTNYHCHTSFVDPDVDREMTPAYYAGQLGARMRRAVVLNHGYNYYVMPSRPEWAADEVTSKIREAGNERIRAAMQAVRELNNPDIFFGIETDLSQDGQPLHDTRFTEDFDVILYGDHYLHWVAKMDSVKDRVRAWLDHVDAVLARPDLDVFAHPFRELRAISNNEVPAEAVERVLRWADERRVGLELNSQDYVPEAATVRMLKFAADRGLPVVVGTDAHTKDRILAFEVAERRLELAGLTPADLFMPQVEDFMARKGRRSEAKASVLTKNGHNYIEFR
jgi:histidinol phosphatase-like PHP family hydrolase